MSEKLRDVINRMKAQQNSQSSNSVEDEATPINQGNNAPVPLNQSTEGSIDGNKAYYGEDDGEDEYPNQQVQQPIQQPQLPVIKPIQQTAPLTAPQSVKPVEVEKEAQLSQEQIEQLMQEVESLQNTGRYRLELLHQLQEVNKALVVIAGVLVDLSGNGKD